MVTAQLGDLERSILAGGEGWAHEAAARLRAERRAVAGGWPGTLSEARERVGELTRGRGVSMPSFDQLTRLLYAEAREVWQAQAQREEE
ncbi:MAG: hypothetical protein OHK0013_10010 [Sandaracinaceae bacterium]